MIKMVKIFFGFSLLNIIVHANDFIDLTYYQKFDRGIELYQQGRFNLANDLFTDILKNEREYRDPAAQY